MGIQHLRIDRFSVEVQDTYRKIARLFEATEHDDWPSSRYSEITSAFMSESSKLKDHIVGGKFVSEASRQKVEDDLVSAEALIEEVRPEAPLLDDVANLRYRVMEMVVEDD